MSHHPVEVDREAVTGLSTSPVDPLRYAGQTPDRWESTGIILSMIPQGARVLDVGCGTGSVSTLVRDLRGATVVGIEPNADRARHAVEAHGLHVIHGVYAPDVAERFGPFDVVLFADVLEHLVDPAEALRQVRPALAPGGRVVASIPNVAHWSVRVDLLRGRFDYTPTGIMDATHLRWFTCDSVVRLFAAAGYAVETLRHSAGWWLARERRPWRWMPERVGLGITRRLANRWPGPFGCQHVVVATPTDARPMDPTPQRGS